MCLVRRFEIILLLTWSNFDIKSLLARSESDQV